MVKHVSMHVLVLLAGRRILARWASATDNILTEGKLRSSVIYHLLGPQLGSAWPPLIRSFLSVLITTTCLLQLFLELKVDVARLLGGSEV